MTAPSHVRPDHRSIETTCKLSGRKVHRTNQGANVLEARLAIGKMQELLFKLEEKENPSILKYNFLSRSDPHLLSHQ